MEPRTLIFFSTGEISIPLFQALLNDARFKVLGLVCQPDRGEPRAIKKLAVEKGLPVYQPEKLSKDEVLLETLKKNPPDFILTFSYGQILNEAWLSLPRLAPMNVHPSLLPKYRGPTPPQAALLNGDAETGLSLIKMTKGMDEGPIAFQEKMAIAPHMTSTLLFDEFARLAAEKIPDALMAIAEQGEQIFKEQDESQATYCKMTEREDGRINFQEPAAKIMNRFRAYTPWPGLFTTYLGKRLKILDLEMTEDAIEPGKVKCEKHVILVGTSDGALKLKSLQLEGKTVLHPEAFILGQPAFCSSVLPS
ncbi:MAG: methionyl-tRNA formyltransferase [Patescibacteria group bacterium]